jgi:hypothetical protein
MHGFVSPLASLHTLRSFVASARMQDLLLRAKYLVFAAMLMAARKCARSDGPAGKVAVSGLLQGRR